ncbi:hypothetical protein HanIR_Chr17g0864551 [Helianthus annuus]|nr:hypothetical protein HanIR_Chr17g0864551 [Helianthus annuus]
MTDPLVTLTKDEVVELMDEFFFSQVDFELLIVIGATWGGGAPDRSKFSLSSVRLET